MNEHSKVIEFGSKANADSYIAVGWELIETRAETFALGRTIILYRLGWPEGSGEPVMPPTDDDLRDLEKDLQQIEEILQPPSPTQRNVGGLLHVPYNKRGA